tara:strand:+ start:53 stop:373 length:321 start_codon:yes stop_codon:yes gene_type:complete
MNKSTQTTDQTTDQRLTHIEDKLEAMSALLIKLNDNIEKINESIDDFSESLDEELIPECKKMSSHIDFVENVYDTVKHPLGFLCNKIKKLTTSTTYTLTNIEVNNE